MPIINSTAFPLTAHPVHQPELEVDTLRCSAPKPESCILDEETAKCRKEQEVEKRFEKHDRELNGGIPK
jgi:hypothetical protein